MQLGRSGSFSDRQWVQFLKFFVSHYQVVAGKVRVCLQRAGVWGLSYSESSYSHFIPGFSDTRMESVTLSISY
jgi:hypothetical protein